MQDGAEYEVLAKGVVAEEVLRVARRLRCTLIVLATHGRTDLLNRLEKRSRRRDGRTLG